MADNTAPQWTTIECYEREYAGHWIRVTKYTDHWKWRIAAYRNSDGYGGNAETMEAANAAAVMAIRNRIELNRPTCRRRFCENTAGAAGLCAEHRGR